MKESATPPVSLREISAETVRAVCALAVRADQQHFVAPNAVSLAQALFSAQAWYRAVYAGDELAGFVMLYDATLGPASPEPPVIEVWRFMVDQRFQGQGVGREAMLRLIEHVRAKGVVDKLELSYVPGPGCPEPFYRSMGFVPTGRVDGAEVVMALALTRAC